MTKRALLIIAACLTLAGCGAVPIDANLAAKASPAVKVLTLAPGQSAEVRCPGATAKPAPVNAWPLRATCASGATTTTTTVKRTTTTERPTTTTRPPTTTTRPTTTVARTTSTTKPTTTTTAPSSAATPASLMPDSLFNQAVTSWPVDPNSSELAKAVVSDYEAAYGNFGVSDNDPIFSVPAGTPNSSISVGAGCGDFLPSTGSEVPVPADIVLNGSGDNPLFLFSTSLNKVWEFWQFAKTSTGYSACWGGEATLSTFDGVFPGGYGESATGISYLATAVTEADVASGQIDHAIAMTLTNCNGSVYPADRTDCGSDPGNPGEGQWFRFAPGTPEPAGLSPFAQMVFTAIEKYGLVVTDKSGAIEISAEQPSDWAAEGNKGADPLTASWDGQAEYQVINSLPWSDLQAIDPPAGGSK